MKIKTLIFSQSNKIYLTPPYLKGEDGSATSPVRAFPDPRGSLSSTIPAKDIAQSISSAKGNSKCGWSWVSVVLASTGPICLQVCQSAWCSQYPQQWKLYHTKIYLTKIFFDMKTSQSVWYIATKCVMVVITYCWLVFWPDPPPLRGDSHFGNVHWNLVISKANFHSQAFLTLIRIECINSLANTQTEFRFWVMGHI